MTVLYRRAEVGNHVPNAGVEQKNKYKHLVIGIHVKIFQLVPTILLYFAFNRRQITYLQKAPEHN